MASVELRDVSVVRAAPRSRRRAERVAAPAALDGVELDVADGEFVAVIGESGAGKTTLLRVVAGLDRVTRGQVGIGGVDVSRLGPADRDVAMVFQQPSLLPNRDVGRNISFPLEVRARSREEIRERVLAETRALHIDGLLARSPDQLSAGEQQLVQIARAMVRVPSVLLLDEPLTRLDAWTRQRMRTELRILQRGYGVTTLMATNDPLEAMAMPDRLVVLEAGRMSQVGIPLDVYRNPSTLTAAALTGDLDVALVRVETDRAGDGGFWLVDDRQRDRAWSPALAPHAGRRLLRGTRPDGASLLFDPASGARVV